MVMCFVYILLLIDFHCERWDETAVNSDIKQNIALYHFNTNIQPQDFQLCYHPQIMSKENQQPGLIFL